MKVNLVDVLFRLRNKLWIKWFLESLLTEKERANIVQRITILQKLEQGAPHHEIAKELNVGVATVTRGTKVMKEKNYQKIKRYLCE